MNLYQRKTKKLQESPKVIGKLSVQMNIIGYIGDFLNI